MISLLEYMDGDEYMTPAMTRALANATRHKSEDWMQVNEAQRALQAADAQRMIAPCLMPIYEWRIDKVNPLAAMCGHKDAPGLTDRLIAPAPEMVEWLDTVADSTALPYDATMMRVAPMAHKFGGWGV